MRNGVKRSSRFRQGINYYRTETILNSMVSAGKGVCKDRANKV